VSDGRTLEGTESIQLDRAFDELVDHLLRADVRGATDLALRLAGSGTPLRQLVTDLLAPAQVEVGRRWQCDDWSIAQEHAATAVTDAVLSALTFRSGRSPDGDPVIVVCAEDEWHLLPARMVAEVLSDAGIPVSFLGGSIPADHLRRYLTDLRPPAVLISATVPMNLPGVARSIRAAHRAGVPAIAGGAALGSTPRRAATLGAAAWAADVAEVPSILSAWSEQRPALPPGVEPPPEAARLAEDRHDIVVATVLELVDHMPVVARFTTEQISRTHEDLVYILRFAEAAIHVDDDELFHDFVRWTDEVLTSRGLPPSTLPRSMDALGIVLDEGRFPRTSQLVRRHGATGGAG
jgi:methanogenic corrinoid protein MtbC1